MQIFRYFIFALWKLAILHLLLNIYVYIFLNFVSLKSNSYINTHRPYFLFKGTEFFYICKKGRKGFFLFYPLCSIFNLDLCIECPGKRPVYTYLKSTMFPAYAFPYVVFALRKGSIFLPFRKQILIPRSLGPPGHHPRHSRVLPLFSVSRITPCCILRCSRNVIYTRRSLWRVSIFILVSQPFSENFSRSLHL